MTDAVATASIPATVISPAVTIAPPSTNTVLPPLQIANVSAPTTTLPVMSGQADLMAVLRAMQQTIERLQAAVDNQPPSEQHVTGTRRQPVKQRLNFHEEAGTSKTPERIQVEDGQFDDERRNPRSRRQESSYEAHSTRRDSYEHCAERYTSAPVIIGRPFTEEVDHFPTPQNFKMPPCGSYDGTGDPMEHLARFTSGMNLHLVPDQIMCRAFPVTLKGAAHVWFQHLASRSISCWAQLAESFRNNFLTSRIQRKNSSALFRIVQGPKESLKSYYASFNTEKLLIDNLDSGVTFAAMARGVRPGTPLRFSLNKRPPEHMADLLDRVEKYLRAEEDSITTTQDEGTSGQKRRDRPEGKILEEPKRSRTTLSKHFTPLTASREHILNQIKGQDILKWPKPMRMPADRRDAQLYCQFHKDHGHTTEECKVLRRKIENLIARGHLKQFVKTEHQGGNRGGGQRRHDGSAPKEPPVINTISGGLSAGGTSRSARKAYARQVNLTQRPAKRPKVPATISFDDTDLEEVLTPHDDALTEVTNRTLLQGLRKKLDGAKGLWVDELHKILWAYRTTTRNPTGKTPFNLAFGTEALIPVKIGLPSLRLLTYDPNMNDEALRCNLDLLDEQRDQAQLRLAAYQHRVARYHDRRIRPLAFHIGDLVLHRVEASTPRDAIGKLSPNWEGPYRVTKYGGPGSYHLEHLDGKSIPRTWNATNLRRYYA
ncbi:hypothetical protein RJ639_012844 [Escallonia herrerae]|uniref:Retrotransposon gag domain-containing protein n=1 Tax=Escallonia herrerae TaxID=1293975 RepID=A0AA88VN84_9ASTE|nr:hypothetical protein RJ639_012844 [Escallonia herrerae]